MTKIDRNPRIHRGHKILRAVLGMAVIFTLLLGALPGLAEESDDLAKLRTMLIQEKVTPQQYQQARSLFEKDAASLTESEQAALRAYRFVAQGVLKPDELAAALEAAGLDRGAVTAAAPDVGEMSMDVVGDHVWSAERLVDFWTKQAERHIGQVNDIETRDELWQELAKIQMDRRDYIQAWEIHDKRLRGERAKQHLAYHLVRHLAYVEDHTSKNWPMTQILAQFNRSVKHDGEPIQLRDAVTALAAKDLARFNETMTAFSAGLKSEFHEDIKGNIRLDASRATMVLLHAGQAAKVHEMFVKELMPMMDDKSLSHLTHLAAMSRLTAKVRQTYADSKRIDAVVKLIDSTRVDWPWIWDVYVYEFLLPRGELDVAEIMLLLPERAPGRDNTRLDPRSITQVRAQKLWLAMAIAEIYLAREQPSNARRVLRTSLPLLGHVMSPPEKVDDDPDIFDLLDRAGVKTNTPRAGSGSVFLYLSLLDRADDQQTARKIIQQLPPESWSVKERLRLAQAMLSCGLLAEARPIVADVLAQDAERLFELLDELVLQGRDSLANSVSIIELAYGVGAIESAQDALRKNAGIQRWLKHPPTPSRMVEIYKWADLLGDDRLRDQVYVYLNRIHLTPQRIADIRSAPSEYRRIAEEGWPRPADWIEAHIEAQSIDKTTKAASRAEAALRALIEAGWKMEQAALYAPVRAAREKVSDRDDPWVGEAESMVDDLGRIGDGLIREYEAKPARTQRLDESFDQISNQLTAIAVYQYASGDHAAGRQTVALAVDLLDRKLAAMGERADHMKHYRYQPIAEAINLHDPLTVVDLVKKMKATPTREPLSYDYLLWPIVEAYRGQDRALAVRRALAVIGTNQPELSYLVTKAETALKADEFDAFLANMDLITHAPTRDWLWGGAAFKYIRADKPDRAYEYARRMASGKSRDALLRNVAKDDLVAPAEKRDGYALTRQVLLLIDSDDLKVKLAKELATKDRRAGRSDELRALAKLMPDDVSREWVLVELARSLAEAKEWDEASTIAESLKTDAERPWGQFVIGRARAKAGMIEQAKAILRQLKSDRARNALIQSIAVAMVKAGDVDDAIRMTGLAKWPSKTWGSLLHELASTGQWAGYRQVVAAMPTSDEKVVDAVIFNLAEDLAQSSSFDTLRRAVGLIRPDDVESMQRAADVYAWEINEAFSDGHDWRLDASTDDRIVTVRAQQLLAASKTMTNAQRRRVIQNDLISHLTRTRHDETLKQIEPLVSAELRVEVRAAVVECLIQTRRIDEMNELIAGMSEAADRDAARRRAVGVFCEQGRQSRTWEILKTIESDKVWYHAIKTVIESAARDPGRTSALTRAVGLLYDNTDRFKAAYGDKVPRHVERRLVDPLVDVYLGDLKYDEAIKMIGRMVTPYDRDQMLTRVALHAMKMDDVHASYSALREMYYRDLWAATTAEVLVIQARDGEVERVVAGADAIEKSARSIDEKKYALLCVDRLLDTAIPLAWARQVDRATKLIAEAKTLYEPNAPKADDIFEIVDAPAQGNTTPEEIERIKQKRELLSDRESMRQLSKQVREMVGIGRYDEATRLAKAIGDEALTKYCLAQKNLVEVVALTRAGKASSAIATYLRGRTDPVERVDAILAVLAALDDRPVTD